MSPITDPTPRSNPNPSKQRKLNRSLPQLKRNAACLPCRRRRIKCDAGKPHCSSCVRSYHFLARTHPDEERDAKGIQCFYDDEALEGDEEDSSVDKEHVLPTHRDKGSKRKERAEDEDPQDVIKRLENKVFELQQALSSTSTAPPLSADNTGSASGPNSVPRTASSTSASLKEPRLWSGPFETPTNIMKGDTPTNILKEVYNSAMGSFTSDPPSIDFDFGMPSAAGDSINGAGFAASVAGGIDDEAGKMGGAFLDLLWPGWPPTLPTPAMVDHLVETFFTMVPSIGRIIHRQTFLTRLALPPTHADFPHRALLHAMCAAASSYSAAVKVRSGQENVAKYSDDSRRARGKGFDVNISDDPCFSERNAMYAIAALKYDHMNGKGLFDLVQAMLILAHWSQSNARWIDGWMLIGAATRLVVCLGLLNQNPDISFSMPTIKKSILDPPKNDAEREERIATVFYVFFFDVSSSASSGWPCCLPIDELNSKLPGSREEFDLGMYINKNPQSFHSPEFYTSHPVPDGYVMLVKSNALLMRATKFTRRCRSMDPSERLLACQLPEFRQIDSDIAAFGLSFPPSLRDPVQYRNGYSKGIDADLISAHLVPHIAAIFLHEPFADLADPQCPSTTRILSEARAVLNIVYLIVSSSADISYMLLPMASCDYFFTATRTLLLFYQNALQTGDQAMAQVHRSEIAVFKMAYSSLATRVVMAAKHLAMLDMMEHSLERETCPNAPVAGPWQTAPRCDQVIQTTMVSLNAKLSSSLLWFPQTHPDGLLASELDKAQRGQADTGVTVHDILDQKRGYVRRADSSNPSSSGPSPIDPLNWLTLNGGSSQGAQVILLSPDSAELGGTATAGKVQ